MGYNTAALRAEIQGLLNAYDALSQDQIQALLAKKGIHADYHQVNRALNSPYNPALGETPFARTDDTSGTSRWVWFAVTTASPVTQREFEIKTATALTQLTKTRDNLLTPAIKAGAVGKGDGDALDTSLLHLGISITQLEMAVNAGNEKAAGIKMVKEANKALDEVKAEKEAIAAEKAALAKREQEFAVKEKALLKASAAKKPFIKK